MRGLSLERKILFLVMLPILGGLIPSTILIVQADRNLGEMHTLGQLGQLVRKLSEIETALHKEESVWYFFKPAWVATAEEKKETPAQEAAEHKGKGHHKKAEGAEKKADAPAAK